MFASVTRVPELSVTFAAVAAVSGASVGDSNSPAMVDAPPPITPLVTTSASTFSMKSGDVVAAPAGKRLSTLQEVARPTWDLSDGAFS